MSRMHETGLGRLLATRHDNGADFRATPDGRLRNVRPVSTLTALMVMSELKVEKSHEALQGAAGLVLKAIRDDGQARVYPKGAIYLPHDRCCRGAF